MWPEVLSDIAEQITQRLAAVNESAQVYLGNSSQVPSVNQINVYRGELRPDADGRYCDAIDSSLVVFVEIWVNEEIEPDGLTDLEYANNRTIASYRQLAKFSQVIRSADFFGDAVAYDASVVRIESDNDQFRPTCAERIEYSVELRGS